MAKAPTEKQLAARKKFGEQARARAAARKNQNPQTNTPSQPAQNQNNLITLTQDQFDQLISKLDSGSTRDKAAAPSMTPGVGLQTNPFGQVVGTVTKFNVDPLYYPSPIERLLDACEADQRMRRHNVRENYFVTFDITSKPYVTKDNLNVQEPTFHLTLYANEYDDQGVETGRAIIIQTLHMNEDEELARQFAAEQSPPITVSDESLRDLMNETRFERSWRWLTDVFYPPRNFDMNIDAREEAIGGSVVKVVTKSNVKGFGNPTPKIKDEELA